ncbi:DUF551 domain-containing protein, partial [Raoultella sp. TW_WC1a-1]
MTSKLTRERIEQYANDPRMCNINDEIREMARMALAAMGSEPVAYTEKHEISNMHATGLYLRAWPADRARNAVEGYTIPLYRHAQPAVDSDFIPKNLDKALGVLGMAIPESREEFNFQTE